MERKLWNKASNCMNFRQIEKIRGNEKPEVHELRIPINVYD